MVKEALARISGSLFDLCRMLTLAVDTNAYLVSHQPRKLTDGNLTYNAGASWFFPTVMNASEISWKQSSKT